DPPSGRQEACTGEPMPSRLPAWWGLGAAILAALAVCASEANAQNGAKPGAGKQPETLPAPQPLSRLAPEPNPAPLLNPQVKPIDLCSAMKLAGGYNPEILLARELVVESDARRQLAAAQILPNLNYGTNYDHHQGTLQQSTGRIIQVNRDSLYLGLG